MNFNPIHRQTAIFLTLFIVMTISHSLYAAVSLDRTRIIFDGSQKSTSVNIGNKNKQLPYLAQAWLENSKEQKINTHFVILPPIQRLEAGQESQVKIEALPETQTLPQDRESIFYFNLREIPPKSKKQNVLQLALQSKIKLFYRPKAIVKRSPAEEYKKVTIYKSGNQTKIKNPTPFYLTVLNGASTQSGLAKSKFTPVMIAPFSEGNLGMSFSQLGQKPVFTYINDYGGKPHLYFQCQANSCSVIPNPS